MSDRSVKDDVLARLDEAFKDRAVPGDDDLMSEPFYEESDEGDTFERLRGRKWSDLTIEDIQWHHFTLYKLTPTATAYYFPAFLLAEVADPSETDFTGDQLIEFLLGSNARWTSLEDIWDLFGREEQRAVLDAVNYVSECNPEHGLAEIFRRLEKRFAEARGSQG